MSERFVHLYITNNGEFGSIFVRKHKSIGCHPWPIELRPDQPNDGWLGLRVFMKFYRCIPFNFEVVSETGQRVSYALHPDPRIGFDGAPYQRNMKLGAPRPNALVPITSAL